MHHLGGVFIEENGVFTQKENEKSYFSFNLIFPNKKRDYYADSKEEYNQWLLFIQLATGNYLNNDKYELKEIIGKGKFGLVKKAINKESNELVAVKIISKLALSLEELQLAKQEVEILKICHNEYLIQLVDYYETKEEFYIYLEYCSGKDLFSWFSNRKFKITEEQAKHIITQILYGVSYLHQHGIIHRDLKPENILLVDSSDFPKLKISDFGLSKIIGPDQVACESYGTLSYASPEVLKNKPYNEKSDIWTIGIMAYLFLVGHLPFDGNSSKDIIEQTVFKNTPFPFNLWKEISMEARNFVELCLNKNPNKRISIKEALETSWIKFYS